MSDLVVIDQRTTVALVPQADSLLVLAPQNAQGPVGPPGSAKTFVGMSSIRGFDAGNFYGLFGDPNDGGTPTFAGIGMAIPFAATIKNMYLHGDASGSGNDTWALCKNGVATSLSVTCNGTTSGSDTVHSVSVVAGDLLCWLCVATSNFGTISVSCEIDPS